VYRRHASNKFFLKCPKYLIFILICLEKLKTHFEGGEIKKLYAECHNEDQESTSPNFVRKAKGCRRTAFGKN
jgi:hypothetical protein